MSDSNAFENALQLLIWNNTDIANVGDATGLRGSSTAGSFYFSLHTADPGEAGNQSTSEATYTGYARVAVARSGAGFTVSGNQVVNAATITFPICTAGSSTITHIGIGTDSSGTGLLKSSAPIGSTNLPIAFTGKASNDTLTIPGHAFSVSDRCTFFAIPGSTLPAGITHGTIYFIKTVSSNDVTISTTDGGSTLDITADGEGISQKVVPLAVSVNIQPSIAASSFVCAHD